MSTDKPDDSSLTGENLIFLISQPRSGSTMLQKILGAHPKIHTVSEPWIALHPLFALREHGLATDYDPMLARRAVNEFLRHLPDGEDAYWEAVQRMLSALYSRALDGSGKSIFLDKTPRYYFIIPELRRVFPRARFVFLLRNPLAVLSSILDTWIKGEDPLQLRAFRHDLMVAPRLLMEGVRSCGPNAIVVRYEDLTSKPTEEIRRLCASLDISFHPRMTKYGATTGEERWLYGDQGTVNRETGPLMVPPTRWRSTLKQSLRWEAWARSYVEAMGPGLVRELGYDYDQLTADLPVRPAPDDWQIITESDEEAREGRIAKLESAAAERLAAMQDRDREIQAREQRIAALESTAAERLAAMQDRDREIQAREQRIAALESTAAERFAAMQDRDLLISRLHTKIESRDRAIREIARRADASESAAGERLATMVAWDQVIATLQAELAALHERLEGALADTEQIRALKSRLESELAALIREKDTLCQHINRLEKEGLRDYLARRYSRDRPKPSRG